MMGAVGKISRRGFLASSLAMAGGVRLAFAQGEVPWLAEVSRPPEGWTPGEARLPSPMVDGSGRPIGTLAAWQRRRAELRAEWLEFLGALRLAREKPVLQVLEEDRPDGCVRQLVRYESEPGLPVEGYLLSPVDAAGPRPGVVVLHSTVDYTIRQPAGLEGPPGRHIGLKLAQRGMVAFCPRCFLWTWEGDRLDPEQVPRFHARHPGSRGMAKMLWDAQRAVDVLESLPGVDAARIGTAGHSLGAKEALYLAAFDERVKAAVSSEGGIGIGFSNWDAPWYLGEDWGTQRPTRDHHELLALAAPRPFLLIGGDSADGSQSWPYIEAALPNYRIYGLPARLGLLNHGQGHSLPPEAEARIYEWLETYL